MFHYTENGWNVKHFLTPMEDDQGWIRRPVKIAALPMVSIIQKPMKKSSEI